MLISASAPGKLVLLGEYAVLEGAPALVMAVDRYAQVSLERLAKKLFSFTAPQVAVETVACWINRQNSVVWDNVASWLIGRFSLVGTVLSGLGQQHLLSALKTRGFHAFLDTAAFFQRGSTKLGLGSSAALTVSLASAIAHLAGQKELIADRSRWLGMLLQLHQNFQQGQGSGLDVAASLYGGVIEYQRIKRLPPSCVPRELPSTLYIRCVWTGRSVSTAVFVKQYQLWKQQDPRAAAQLAQLQQTASSGAVTLQRGEADSFVAIVAEYGKQLQQLGHSVGSDIYSAEHQAIARIAQKAVVVYKPSGAGGGDIGLVFSTDPEKLDYFAEQITLGGFSMVDIGVASRGLTVEFT